MSSRKILFIVAAITLLVWIGTAIYLLQPVKKPAPAVSPPLTSANSPLPNRKRLGNAILPTPLALPTGAIVIGENCSKLLGKMVLIEKSPEEKLKTVNLVYDLNKDGLVSSSDIKQVVNKTTSGPESEQWCKEILGKEIK